MKLLGKCRATCACDMLHVPVICYVCLWYATCACGMLQIVCISCLCIHTSAGIKPPRCVSVDLPGHGSTTVGSSSSSGNGSGGNSSNSSSSNGGGNGMDGRYSLQAASTATAQLVEALGLPGCVLVGYSLGARLALLMSTSRPELFSALVLIGGTAGIEVRGLDPLCWIIHKLTGLKRPGMLYPGTSRKCD